MSTVTVYVPVAPEPDAAAIGRADRRAVVDTPVVTLVENGKPKARDLLIHVAEALRPTYPRLEVDVYSKASAARPLDGDEAKVIAARANLVITGVGD